MAVEEGGVEVVLAGVDERPLIEGLFQFYAYDFSELEPPDSDDFEPGADGKYGTGSRMDDYWGDPTLVAMIIRRQGRPVGFALINSVAHSGSPADRNMAEFFVMRKHRRGGVARDAVRTILSRFPGRWEIAIAERNHAARAFWPAAVTATPGVRDLTTIQGDGVHWRGPILQFVADRVRLPPAPE